MEIKKYYDGKDELDPDEELTNRVKEYMKTHPDVNYLEASNAVLAADPELAKAYAMGSQRDYKAEADAKNSKYSDPKPRARQMSEYQQGLAASAEISRQADFDA